MIRITRFACSAAALVSLVLASEAMTQTAQERPTTQERQTTQPRTQGTQPTQRESPAREQREPERPGRPVNLAIEVTITDQVESEPAQKKTVSMIVADRTQGRVRASGIAQARDTPGPQAVRLNVDAFPEIQANDSVRLRLTLEYEPLPPTASGDSPRRPSALSEMLTVILQPGKPVTVSRAVDPLTNRRTSVDVVATIAK